MIRCKDCAWFAPVESNPAALAMHENLIRIFGDVLPRREGETGVCRKVTYCAERPVLTNSEGYCHRAERKNNDN